MWVSGFERDKLSIQAIELPVTDLRTILDVVAMRMPAKLLSEGLGSALDLVGLFRRRSLGGVRRTLGQRNSNFW